jgi:hypothetical protein
MYYVSRRKVYSNNYVARRHISVINVTTGQEFIAHHTKTVLFILSRNRGGWIKANVTVGSLNVCFLKIGHGMSKIAAKPGFLTFQVRKDIGLILGLPNEPHCT